MSRRLYPAVIEKGGDGYGVTFPDLPGCTSAGDTLEHAFVNAHEALAGHIDVSLEYGEQPPNASPVEKVAADPENQSAAIMLIGVTVPSRDQRIELAIDEGLLEEIDALGADRSQFLADAARVELARRLAG